MLYQPPDSQAPSPQTSNSQRYQNYWIYQINFSDLIPLQYALGDKDEVLATRENDIRIRLDYDVIDNFGNRALDLIRG